MIFSQAFSGLSYLRKTFLIGILRSDPLISVMLPLMCIQCQIHKLLCTLPTKYLLSQLLFFFRLMDKT